VCVCVASVIPMLWGQIVSRKMAKFEILIETFFGPNEESSFLITY